MTRDLRGQGQAGSGSALARSPAWAWRDGWPLLALLALAAFLGGLALRYRPDAPAAAPVRC